MRPTHFLSSVGLIVITVGVAPRLAGAAGALPDSVLGVRCADVYLLGIDRQENIRAGLIRQWCGLEPFASAVVEPSEDYGGGGSDVSGPDPNPFVVHNTSMVWGTPDAQTIVVQYNDNSAPSNNSGVSVSFDGGYTFVRLRPSPFATGHGQNFGGPIVVYNNALGKFFGGDLVAGCGGQGIGLWSSIDGMSWTVGACAHNGSLDDRESIWVDNNPDSPYFGRMYISWNDFARDQNIFVTWSDDGTSWAAPVRVQSGGFIRNVQLTGSLGDDGTVFIAGMDEGGGGLADRTNIMYRSLNGGEDWTESVMGPPFSPPGNSRCGYFAKIEPNWRYMGWGQPAGVSPAGWERSTFSSISVIQGSTC